MKMKAWARRGVFAVVFDNTCRGYILYDIYSGVGHGQSKIV